MKVFLTGNRGRIGRVLAADLRALGHDIVGYDRVDGDDILDATVLETAMRGCEAVLHLAALLGLPGESPNEIMRVNLQGTWNVLAAAANLQVGRVLYMSSVDALGVFKGKRKPDYLPLDDAHPCYPATPYAISKRLAEEMCRFWAQSTGIPAICLRPPGVWMPETYREIQAARQVQPAYEWDPYWEYGAFIDVRDLSRASIRALTCDIEAFVCLLVSSADITTSGRSSEELVRLIHPDVEWRGDEESRRDPFRSLLKIDNAQRILAWEPRHSWQAFIENESA